jgi:7-keto-8-aminopelargonate synthetase-like enzyme
LKAEPERVRQLQANGHSFLDQAKKAGLDTMTSAGDSVVPILTGCSIRSVRLRERLLARGINALPIIHPAVPMKAAPLRFFITSKHTEEQIRTIFAITAEELAAVAKKQSLLGRGTLAVAAHQ